MGRTELNINFSSSVINRKKRKSETYIEMTSIIDKTPFQLA